MVEIRQVSSASELAATYEFVRNGLSLDDRHSRGLDFYTRILEETPQLLLVADDKSVIRGALLASIEGNHILIGEVYVDPGCRGQQVGSKLLASVEAAARDLGFHRLLAGALDGVEPFYVRNGFDPLLFLQIEGTDGSILLDKLLDTRLSGLEVVWKDYGENWSKASLRMNRVDKELQKSISRESPSINAGYLVAKEL